MAASAYLFLRRHRRTKQTPIAVGASKETPEKGNAYTKAEMHASERALYETNGQSVVLEVDVVGRLTDGELADSQGELPSTVGIVVSE